MFSDHNDKMIESHMPACLPNLKSLQKNDGVCELTICIRSESNKCAATAAGQTAPIVDVPWPMQCHVAGCNAINALTVKLAR